MEAGGFFLSKMRYFQNHVFKHKFKRTSYLDVGCGTSYHFLVASGFLGDVWLTTSRPKILLFNLT